MAKNVHKAEVNPRNLISTCFKIQSTCTVLKAVLNILHEKELEAEMTNI